MDIIISSDEIKEIEKLKIISEATPIREKIKLYETKYQCSFEEFERKIKEKDEDYLEWDDFIEWKSYLEALKDLERKLREISNAKNIRIA
ncbi:MAG TPA: hypothetical protein VMV49_09880 [Candidatus Deferrimicrobium sp.]|nr:hypothetical protein [Candidatus Deferrimicrobium sp.]